MVELICDSCKKTRRPNGEKRNGHEWILGWDLVSESAHGVQRSIRLLDRWDDRRMAEFGAVHFCSEDCKDKYINRNRLAA